MKIAVSVTAAIHGLARYINEVRYAPAYYEPGAVVQSQPDKMIQFLDNQYAVLEGLDNFMPVELDLSNALDMEIAKRINEE